MSVNLELKNLVERYISIFENKPRLKNLSEVERMKSLFSSVIKSEDPIEEVIAIHNLINETEIKVLTQGDRHVAQELIFIKEQVNALVNNVIDFSQETQIPNHSPKRTVSEEITAEVITPGVAAIRNLTYESENVEPDIEPTNSIDAVFRALKTKLTTEVTAIVMQYHQDTCNDIINVAQQENVISDFVKKVAESVKVLDLPSYKGIIKNIPKILNIFKNVEALNMKLWPTSEDLKAVSELKNLRELNLGSCQNITDDYLANLSKSENLQVLVLPNCKDITNTGLACFVNLTALQSLTLSNCSGITDAGLAHFVNLTALQSLNLSNCSGITGEGFAHLAKNSPNLKSLNLRSCINITSDGFANLENFSNLESINVSYCRITDLICSHLANIPSLKFLNLEGCLNITHVGLAHFANHKNLKYLDLLDINTNCYYQEDTYTGGKGDVYFYYERNPMITEVIKSLKEINPSLEIITRTING